MPVRREARTSATETSPAASATGVKRGKLYPEQGQIGGRNPAAPRGADGGEVRCPALGSAA